MFQHRFRIAIVACVLAVAACDSVDERIAEHYASAQAFTAAGEDQRAMVELRNAIKLNEAYVPARFDLAVLLRKNQRLRPAIGNLLRVVELQPDHVEARMELANIYLLAEQIDEALKHSEAAYRIAQDDTDVLALRGTIALRLGNLDFAEKLAERGIGIDPFHAASGMVLSAHRLKSGDKAESLAIIDRYIGYDETMQELHLARLQILGQMEDMAAIGAQLIRMAELFPENIGFRRALVRWRVRNGQTAEIEDDLRVLVRLQPNEIAPVLDLVRHVIRERGAEAGRAELVAQIEMADEKLELQTALAEMDYRSGDTERAFALLEGIVADGGDDGEQARLILARFNISEKNLVEARALIEATLENDPKNSAALGMRAALDIDEGEVESAIIDLRAALDESPRDVSTLLLLARAYELNGNFELASERYGAAMQASDYDEGAATRFADFLARTNQVEAMEIVLTEASRRQPTSKVLLKRLAEVRLQLRKWVEAEDAARRLRELETDDSFADKALISALSGQKRFEESVSVLQDLAENPEDSAAAMTGLFNVYLQSGRESEAEAFIDGILEENPDNPQALVLRGALRLRQGDLDAAEQDFLRVTELSGESPGGYRALASFYSRTGRHEEAMAALEKGISSSPDAAGLRLLKAMEHERRAEIDLAIAEYREMIDDNPNSLVVANNLASLLSDHYGDDPEAVSFAIKIGKPLQLSTLPAFQDTYGWLQYLNGDYEKALTSLLPAVEGLPDNPWVQFHIGMTYAKMNLVKEARTHLTLAVELGGEGFVAAEEAKETLAALPDAQN